MILINCVSYIAYKEQPTDRDRASFHVPPEQLKRFKQYQSKDRNHMRNLKIPYIPQLSTSPLSDLFIAIVCYSILIKLFILSVLAFSIMFNISYDSFVGFLIIVPTVLYLASIATVALPSISKTIRGFKFLAGLQDLVTNELLLVILIFQVLKLLFRDNLPEKFNTIRICKEYFGEISTLIFHSIVAYIAIEFIILQINIAIHIHNHDKQVL